MIATGIVVGGVVAICVVALLGWVWRRQVLAVSKHQYLIASVSSVLGRPQFPLPLKLFRPQCFGK